MKMTTKGPQCFAFNCFSYKNPHSKAKGITFHKFPNEKRNPELFDQWVQNCRREKKPSPYSLLCSLHFEAQQFDRTGQTTRLREGTVPTIFTLPQHLLSTTMAQKTPVESKRGRVLGEGKGRRKGRGRSRSPSPAEVNRDTTEPQLKSAAERVEGHDGGDGIDVASIGSASQQNKKMKLDTDLSPEEELTMVEWLEVHPIFYNKDLTSYKDIAKKEMMWMEKATEMGRPVADLKSWYSSLRSRFNRLKKKRCGDAEMTERDKWVVRHFDFLRAHVQKRTAVSELPTTSAVSEEVADNPDHPLEPVQSTPTPSTPPTLSTHKQIPEAEEALLAGLEEHSYQMIYLQQPVLDRLGPGAASDRKAFGKWVTSVIHELDQDLWRRCQQEISNTLYRFIKENDQLKRQQEPAAAPTLSTSSQSRQPSPPLQGSKGCRKQ